MDDDDLDLEKEFAEGQKLKADIQMNEENLVFD
jgi:hypothetical protein